MNIYGYIIILLLLIALTASEKVAKKKKNTKDWSKTNFDTVESSWEKGDDPEELQHEFDAMRKISEKKSRFNFDDPAAVRKAMKDQGPFAFAGGSGGKMAFVELNDKQPNGNVWAKADVDRIASLWNVLLKTGSLQANIYNLSEKQLLISVDKSWMLADVMKFALRQPETQKVTLDSKDYFPKDFPVDEEEEL